MGMYLGFTSISDANIARVLADPPLVWKFVAPDDPDAYEDEAKRHHRGGWWSRLFGKRRVVAEDELVMADGEGRDHDLDKAWQGIHYLLTKTAYEGDPPLNFLFAGGRELPGIEVGYAPVRLLTSGEVRRVRDALEDVSENWLRARFDPADMMAKEIYPEIWDREDEDTLGYCIEMFEEMRTYFREIADEGLGTIITIQ